jgi:hypothetical protein
MKILMKVELPKEPATVRLAVALVQYDDQSFGTYLINMDHVEEAKRGLSVGFFSGKYFSKDDRAAADQDFCERIESRVHYYQQCINIATNRR